MSRREGLQMAPAQTFHSGQDAKRMQPLQRPHRGGEQGQDFDANNFPAAYIPKLAEDERVAARQKAFLDPQLRAPAGAVAGGIQRPIPVTESEIQWVLDKEKREEYAQFRSWTEKFFNFKDPAHVKLFEQIAPDYFEARMNAIDNAAQNSAQFAKIRLRGPQSMSDFAFLWAVETGRLKLPVGPLWDPSSYMQGRNSEDNYEYAAFNPFKLYFFGNRKPNVPAAGAYATPAVAPYGDQNQFMFPGVGDRGAYLADDFALPNLALPLQ